MDEGQKMINALIGGVHFSTGEFVMLIGIITIIILLVRK